jgi:hypothetical protein
MQAENAQCLKEIGSVGSVVLLLLNFHLTLILLEWINLDAQTAIKRIFHSDKKSPIWGIFSA